MIFPWLRTLFRVFAVHTLEVSVHGGSQVRLLNIGELRKDSIGALTFGAEIPPYKDGALPTAPKLRYAFPTAPTWQVSIARELQTPDPEPWPS